MTTWYQYLYVNCFTTFAVPCFFMISGVFLLRKNQSISTTIRYRIPKLLLPLLFWSIWYIFINIYIWKSDQYFFLSIVKALFTQQYEHLWFIYAILSVYFTLPFLSFLYLHSTNKLKWYMLFLFLIIPSLVRDSILFIFGYAYMPYFAFCYPQLGLFLLGGFIWEKRELLTNNKMVYFLLFIIGFAVTVISSYYLSIKSGQPNKHFFSNGSLGPVIMAISILVIFIKSEEYFQKLKKFTRKLVNLLGRTTIGVYFVHMFILLFMGNHILNDFVGFSSNTGSLINMISGALLCFILSELLCFFGSQIPYIRNFFLG